MKRFIFLIFLGIYAWPAFSTEIENKAHNIHPTSTIAVCTVHATSTPQPSLPSQATEFISSLFTTQNWPARWSCGEWSEFDGWFYLVSDLLIWLSYFAIPAVLFYFIHKRKENVPFKNIFRLFIAFILLCGLTHLIDVIIFWWPAYRLSALIRFLTAIVSVGTVFALVRIIPNALQLKSPEALEKLIEARTRELKEANEKLKREIEQRERAEEEISKLNKSLSNFTNAIQSSSIVSKTDVKGDITYVNENFEKISGYSKEELLGKNHRIINSGHHDRAFWIEMWKTIAKGENWRNEVKNKRKDGGFYWVDTFIMPFKDESGKIVEFLSIRNDITQRKLAEEDLRKLNENLEGAVREKTEDLVRINRELSRTNELMKSLQSYAQIGVWEADLAANKVIWSEEVFKIHELPPHSFVKLDEGVNYYHPHYRDTIKTAVKEAIEHGKSYDLELKLITHNKNEIWVRSIGLPVFENGKVVGLRGLFQNIDNSKAIEEELRTKQEINALAIEAGEIGVWSWDLQSSKAIWNEYMEKHLGMASEEFSRDYHFFEERLHPDDKIPIENAINAAIQENKKLDIEYRILTGEGKYSHILSKGKVLRDHDGKLSKMIGICLNNTDRKLFEEELNEVKERFRMALEQSPIGMALVSLNGTFIKVNKALSEIVGYSEEEMLNLDFQSITHPDDLETDLNYVQQLLKGKIPSYVLEKRYVHKNGNPIWIQLNVSLVGNEEGTPLYFIAQIQDITKRKNSELEIRKVNEMLEASNRELEAFSYSVSHDLRAPLRSISGYAEVLQEDYSEKLDNEGNRLLRVVSNNALRMGQLIDDLLEFSRVGRKALEKNRVDMGSIVRATWEDLISQQPSDRKIQLLKKDILPAHADINMIKQVWVNLISNALKYTSRKPVAKIEISCEERNNEIVYWIKDNGAGFNMNYSPKLFNVFQRLHSTEEFEGTGVGLAIVRRIIEKHNGKVWAEAAKDEGAAFYFSLPKIENGTERNRNPVGRG